jgi:hypothetical protein
MSRATAILILVCAACEAQSLIPQQNDAPKRTIVDSSQSQKSNTRKPEPASAHDSGSTALDAVITSTENLNTIRDSNVRRLSDGCSPDITARIGELRAQLGLKNDSAKKDPSSETAMLALASSWFKNGPVNPSANPPAPPQQNKSDLLASVLPGTEPRPVPRDTVSLQAELDNLLAACAPRKR